MFTIEKLPTNAAASEQMIQEVAVIEALIQLQDAWAYQVLTELLEQDSINILVVYYQHMEYQDSVDKIVGYCLYQTVFEQAEILRIGTHPDHQRKGIASHLFSRLNQELQNNKVENLVLEVRADNAPAIALYEQQEFVHIHKRKGYYKLPHQPAIDALVMQRSYV